MLAERIKYFRKCRGLTQEALGKLIGVTKTTICLYEGGRRPDWERIVKLADVLQIPRDLFSSEELDGILADAFEEYFDDPAPHLAGHVIQFRRSTLDKAQ